jgi:imidazolonepropionase-like amidohydrolase
MVTYEASSREGKSYGITEHQLQKINMAREKSVEGLTHAYRAGCKIGSGSDLLGDMQAQRAVEFELKGQVMKPMEVLLSATKVNAELFRMSHQIGKLDGESR